MDGNPHFMDIHSHLSHQKHHSLSRSQTAPQSPPTLKKHHHHHHHNHAKADRKVAQSAVALNPPPSALSRNSAVPSPAVSQIHSRRGSVAVGGEDGGHKEITAEELARASKEGKLRTEELQASITSLTKLSSVTTRRLDDTYYLLLEKMSALSSAISQFQDISKSTSGLYHDFQSEVEALEEEMEGQIEDLDKGFERQQKRIEGLEGRVLGQREKAVKLGERLEGVKRRVEGWERREEEWQARITRRLRMLWGALLSVALFLVIVRFWPSYWIKPQWSPPHSHQSFLLNSAHGTASLDASCCLPPKYIQESCCTATDRTVPDPTENMLRPRDKPSRVQSALPTASTSSWLDAADRTLRLFDEL